jgi:bifunctional DNA-binding transcriptional regulator/antitoxin component of YhaV-PrlF toxin-antitoxin module
MGTGSGPASASDPVPILCSWLVLFFGAQLSCDCEICTLRELVNFQVYCDQSDFLHRVVMNPTEAIMQAIEFQTTVTDDGNITIPSAYRRQVKGTVRVIILTEMPATEPSIIEELLQNPRKVANFKPLTRDEIYDRTL